MQNQITRMPLEEIRNHIIASMGPMYPMTDKPIFDVYTTDGYRDAKKANKDMDTTYIGSFLTYHHDGECEYATFRRTGDDVTTTLIRLEDICHLQLSEEQGGFRD